MGTHGLRPSDLLDQVTNVLSRQEYTRRPSIHGVVLDEAPVHRGVDGSFVEILRVNERHEGEQFPGFHPLQWNYSVLEPGAVKAWHLHLRQDDLWIIPHDSSVLVGLVDLRKGSPTASQSQRLALGGGRCHRLLIPQGVAHGVANLSTHPQSMLYAVSRFFIADPEETDEWRLPWDQLGEQFWRLEKG